jgi:flagellar protein FliO/FliZ
MEKNFIYMILQLAVILPFILFLIYLSLKVGGSKLQSLQSGRFIKVLERVSLSKENSVLAVKIGQKGYVISSSNGRVEILLELSDEEVLRIEKTKIMPQYDSITELYKNLMWKRKVKK